MDLNVSIVILDELEDSVVKSTGTLSLSSGEIRAVVYEDYDVDTRGLPAEDEAYEFTSGVLSHSGKEVEFKVDVDVLSGKYSVTASELLELKGRAARLFTDVAAAAEAAQAQAPAPAAKVAKKAARKTAAKAVKKSG